MVLLNTNPYIKQTPAIRSYQSSDRNVPDKRHVQCTNNLCKFFCTNVPDVSSGLQVSSCTHTHTCKLAPNS